MNLNTTITTAIWNYPIFFRGEDFKTSRRHVLQHLFLAIGNGFCWHDGELVDKSSNKQIKEKLPPNYFKIKIPWTTGGGILLEEDTRVTRFSFYPLSDYSALASLPDDIRPDWLAAAEEVFLDYVSLLGFNVLRTAKKHQKLFMEIAARIEELKGSTKQKTTKPLTKKEKRSKRTA